jgi:hypothetical protein
MLLVSSIPPLGSVHCICGVGEGCWIKCCGWTVDQYLTCVDQGRAASAEIAKFLRKSLGQSQVWALLSFLLWSFQVWWWLLLYESDFFLSLCLVAGFYLSSVKLAGWGLIWGACNSSSRQFFCQRTVLDIFVCLNHEPIQNFFFPNMGRTSKFCLYYVSQFKTYHHHLSKQQQWWISLEL